MAKWKHIPKAAGVYVIRNLIDGLVYVGSTKNLQNRVRSHWWMLKRGVHNNHRLQAACNQYGRDSFRFEVLELVSVDRIAREQFWMDKLESYKATCGYNISVRAESRKSSKLDEFRLASVRKSYRERSKRLPGFIDPYGNVVTIDYVPDFCKARGWPQSAVSALALGKITSFRGWTHVNAKPKDREWIKTFDGFVDPQGNEVGTIRNLEAFSNERGLDPSSMNKVYRGAMRSYKGWTNPLNLKPRGPRKPYAGKLVVGYIDPNGHAVEIKNLAKFCRENQLDESTMCKLRVGKALSSKGWTFDPSRN